MFGKNLFNILRRPSIQPSIYRVPRRNFAQVGIVISTPPRHPCSYGEKLLHILFMYCFWLTPMAYFLTQIKVWRRQYIS